MVYPLHQAPSVGVSPEEVYSKSGVDLELHWSHTGVALDSDRSTTGVEWDLELVGRAAQCVVG
jgi:hypothetical protein